MRIEAVADQPSRRQRGSSRLTVYARAVAFAVLAAFVLSVAAGSGGQGAAGRLGGDYPAFFAAGSIVAEGDWVSLYEPARQLEAQQQLFPASDSDFLYFAYPPYVAALYRPLAAIDYRLSYVVHTVLMAAAAIGALWLLRPVVAFVRRHFEVVCIASLLFYPMLRSVTGGQNTALTILLLAGAWRSLHDDNEVAAGLCLGLLLYKPQFALPLLALLLARGAWRAVVSGLATGVVLWVAGAAVMGSDWLRAWWTQVASFAELDAEVNGHNAVSILGVSEALFGAGSTAARLVAGPILAATALALVVLWRRPRVDLDLRFVAAVAGALLLSPHAMFYDVGVLVLVGALAIDRIGRAATGPIVTAWVLALTHLAAPSLGVAPLFVVIIASGAWLTLAWHRAGWTGTVSPGSTRAGGGNAPVEVARPT